MSTSHIFAEGSFTLRFAGAGLVPADNLAESLDAWGCLYARVPAILAAEELHAVEEPGPDDTCPRWHLRYPPQPPAPAVVAPPRVVEAVARFRRCVGPEKVLEGLRRWKRSEQWTKEDGRFVPLPGTWLRGWQWRDLPKGMRAEAPEGPPVAVMSYEEFVRAQVAKYPQLADWETNGQSRTELQGDWGRYANAVSRRGA
jgi:hypothetical protein